MQTRSRAVCRLSPAGRYCTCGVLRFLGVVLVRNLDKVTPPWRKALLRRSRACCATNGRMPGRDSSVMLRSLILERDSESIDFKPLEPLRFALHEGKTDNLSKNNNLFKYFARTALAPPSCALRAP